VSVRAVTETEVYEWSDTCVFGELTEQSWNEVCRYNAFEMLECVFGGNGETDEPTAAPTEMPQATPTPVSSAAFLRGITTDKTTAEVYKDDTTVTYTIRTTKDVNDIRLYQVEALGKNYSTVEEYKSNMEFFQEIRLNTLMITETTLTDSFVTSEDGFTRYTATCEEDGEELVWTIRWDLGNTAVKFIRVDAINAKSEEVQSEYIKLNIHYPVLDYTKGLEEAVYRFVELNLEEPFFFTLNPDTITDAEDYRRYFSLNEAVHIYDDELQILSDTSPSRTELAAADAKYEEITYDLLKVSNRDYYRHIMTNSPIYSRGLLDYLAQDAMLFSMYYTTDNTHEHWRAMKRNVLFSHYEEGATFAFYIEITDDMRAIIAYRNGYEIDRNKFPYAYAVLERGTAVLDEIMKDGMTVFEKEHAIYQWMMDNYNAGLKENDLSDINKWYYGVKTAYGLLNGYYADCSGWSATFYTLCNMAGVPCTFVDCMGQAGGVKDKGFKANHRINLVLLDDEFYFVEVYWFYQKTDSSQGDWRFFNMDTEKAKQYYTWRSEEYFGAPLADGDTYKVDEHTGKLLK